MRTCPHCRFLVVDDATVCSVCHKEVDPPVPPPLPPGMVVPPGRAVPGSTGHAGAGDGVWAAGDGSVVTVAPGAPTPDGRAAGPAFSVAPVNGGGGGARTVVVVLGALVAVVVLLGVLAVAAVTFLGSTVETAAPDRWQEYVDGEGRFAAELPGVAVVSEEERPAAGGTMRMTAAEVTNPVWSSAVVFYDLPEVGSVDVPLEALRDGLVDGLSADPTTEDVVLTGSRTVPTPTGDVVEADLTLVREGRPSVGVVRIVRSGADRVVVVTFGPEDEADQVRAQQERVVGTLRSPAT